MGCASSNIIIPVHSFSLSGKNVKEQNNLKNKTVVSENGIVPIYFVKDSIVVNYLNKEIAYRLKEASAIPKNQESEFIDLRSIDDYSKSHILLFMNMDANKEKALNSSDQTLKILFDFKDVFFITDENDQQSLVAANSIIQFGSHSQFDESRLVASAQLKQNQQNIHITQRIKSVIKLFNSKSVKAKSFNIIQSNFSQFQANYPNYIVENQSSKKAIQNEQQQQQQQKQEDNQNVENKLVGENEIFQQTIFTKLQLPLLIYNHKDFIESNDQGVKISTNKPCKIFLQSLNQFQNNVKSRDGQIFYLDQLKINSVCIANQTISQQEIQEIESTFLNIQAKHFSLKQNKENQISMMRFIHSSIESGLNTLILRENNKENFIEVITVIKGLMYEKYQIFSTQIQEYLAVSIPKSIAYQVNNALSIAVNVGDRSVIQKKQSAEVNNTKIDKAHMNRCQQLTELIVQIFKNNKKTKEKSDNFADLFGKLFENIIRNPTEEKFRNIKKENKIIKESILNYKQSTQILALCGFIDKGDSFQNQLSTTDITIIKGDFDLAIKNAYKEVYN
ncbi:hypothetical protein ABPG72_000213 [Tetrahymena utriculariae]